MTSTRSRRPSAGDGRLAWGDHHECLFSGTEWFFRTGYRAELPDWIAALDDVDLGLPGISGIEVIEGLRGWTVVPIIILSARGAEHDKVAALDAGADDYVTKPFGMDELLARLRAALRRIAPAPESAMVETPDFTVDLAAKRVTSPTGEARLTPTEWGLVEVLVRNAGKLVSQRQLLQDVWGPQYGEETNYLRVHTPHPPQARARCGSPALLHHRARHGLPLRGC